MSFIPQKKYYDKHKNELSFKNKIKENNKKANLKRKQKNTTTTITKSRHVS